MNHSDELLEIWVARYLPNFGEISNSVRHHVEQRLQNAIAIPARQATAHKIKRHLASDCASASAETKDLFIEMGTAINSWELKNLTPKVYQLYETLITCYERSFIFSPILEHLHTIDSEVGRLQAAALVIPEFESLLLTMSPMLNELKAVYFSSVTNRHLIGFMTTHIHFTRQHILSHLNLDETIWLTTYLQLLDELICMPWQKICSVLASTGQRPELLALVKKMMPKVNAISTLTYQKALRTYPTHISCQGRIQSAPVQRSSLRDLSMFQAYIWLSVLEDSTAVVERKLLPICLQVFPLTKVDWEMVIFAIQTIVDLIEQQLTQAENVLFSRQAQKIQALFLNNRPKMTQVPLLKEQLQLKNSLENVSYTWKPSPGLG
ncbi:MAG: hypothetical protein ACFB2W_07120 [Leptolyngbyaceae cyanobacterium]|mgnify:CR=1 FL=1